MKRIVNLFLKIVVLTFIFAVISISHPNDAEAYTWDTPLGTSPIVEKVGDNIPTMDEKALDFQLTSGDNELQIYDSNGLLRANQSIFTPNPYIWFERNETARITKVAVYKGKYVDLSFKNVNTIDGLKNSYINVGKNGTLTFYRKNTILLDSYRLYLNMKVLDHDTGEVIPNISFYLPSYKGSINYTLGKFVTGYDKKMTNKILIDASDSYASDNIYIDSKSSAQFDLLSSQKRNNTGQGYFTIYGNTGTDGYLYGVESGVDASSALAIFDPDQVSILPIKYPSLNITETATSLENGTKASIVMEQTLPGQRLDSYIPVNDSFELTISEKNTDFLSVTSDDFQLFVDDVQLPNDGSAYTVTSEQADDTTVIKLKLTTAYMKQVNTMANQGKKVKIVQTSAVINNQEKITAALKDSSFVLPVTADLTYTLQNGLIGELPTPEKDVQLSLEPSLAAEVSSNKIVYQGTTLGDISVNDLVKNVRNENYTWDEVTATVDNPTSVLTTLGSQTISITLKSATFGNTKKIDVPVIVEEAPVDNGELSWYSTASTPEKTKIIQLNQADLDASFAETIYWKTTAKDRNYTIVVSDSEELTTDSILLTTSVSNGAQINAYMEQGIDIPTDRLKVGTNNLIVQLFPTDKVTPGETIQPLDKASLTIELTGQLKLVSVPSELKWTGRLISKGVLTRDIGNDMEVKVLDTRNIPETNKTWSVSAQTEAVDGATVPFDLQWKENAAAKPKSLSNKQLALSKATATQSGDTYSKTWDKDSGVVLYAEDYLGIGDYSNKVKVTWNLYDTPTVN